MIQYKIQKSETAITNKKNIFSLFTEKALSEIKFTDPLLTVYLFILLHFFSAGCENADKNKSHPEIDKANIIQGKSLAAKYCQGCHALPDPSLLTAKIWQQGILPNMGPRLGIFEFNGQQYHSSKNDRYLDKNFYPSAPLLTPGQWRDLMEYYIANAPDSLPHQQRPFNIKNDLSIFKAQAPAFKYNNPTTCFIQVDTTSKTHSLLMENMFSRYIYRLNSKLEIKDSFFCGGPIVNIDFQPNALIACNIGVLNPNNGKFGRAQVIGIGADGKMKADSIPLFDSLRRPVQITAADLNKDGLTDYVVCEFGNLTGALSWMENMGNGKYSRHVIRAYPGAIKAYIQDYNNDGLPDLWVLFAQGEEGIFLFTNKGNGKFSEEELLRFPPVFGSSYFELADFNKDGFPDIVYTCGDNADYSAILKPYHGVYIFMNDGKNHFSQKYFFPINGCYKAMARDFDGDGDLEIATISFFADYAHQPEEGFVYLENKGNFEFHPSSLQVTRLGRWLTMDAADLDGDGRIDIFLGNFSIAPGFMKTDINWAKGPPFLFLKNVGRK
jgi:hypothetical protein